MAKYFLIESRSPFDSAEVNNNYQLASDLASKGNEVSLFLVENGVLAARSTAEINDFSKLTNVNLFADDFSLRERGISPNELKSTIKVAGISIVVEAMAQGSKTMWL